MNAATRMTDQRLGEILVERGIVDTDQLDHALQLARDKQMPLGQALLDGVRVNERDLYAALAEQAGWPFGSADDFDIDASMPLVRSFSVNWLGRHQVLPLRRRNDNAPVVVTADPFAPPDLIEDILRALRRDDIRVVVVTPTDHARLWLQITERLQADEIAEQAEDEAAGREGEGVDGAALLDRILLDAVSARATDVHIEHARNGVIIRFRVDGRLRPGTKPLDPDDGRALVNVIKVRAGMDISERRRPQAGAMRWHAAGNGFDLRVQTMPTVLGENVVLRLLPDDPRRFLIEELGFPKPVAAYWREITQSPAGLALIVGPTGSGKTTTIYAALAELAEQGDRKILTLEDPVEYLADGIQQTSVRERIGLDWAEGIRVMLRQDPDVLLIGEIRDQQTAMAAVRASQTGHLTLSTLHANDAPDAIQRLLDLHLPLRSLLGELLAVFAQRLVPRNCPACRRPAGPGDLTPRLRRWLSRVWDEQRRGPLPHMVGEGCDACDGLGLRGRTAIVDVLISNTETRGILFRADNMDDVLDGLRRSSGWIPFITTALLHVRKGDVPLEAIARVLRRDQAEHQLYDTGERALAALQRDLASEEAP